MIQPILSKSNELVCLGAGYWVRASADQRVYIDYTDGGAMEDAVYEVIRNAQDRSVDSYEFDQNWADWALEYHLTSKRANIYRGLNFDGVQAVLEVGCGCGAITRFLGEKGFQVDSIEGSPRRAEIARLRTEDLDNVQITCSNYHELSLPKTAYDLVIFTGVLEYSGAYAPEGVSPEEQVVNTLKAAVQALKPGGTVVVAIENRTGLKYINGAKEDHLIVPYIGLLGYPASKVSDVTRGIRTWTKNEWHLLLAKAGLNNNEFAYPFPDYKVPQVILTDSFISTASNPEEVLNGIESNVHGEQWLSPMNESMFWKSAAANNSIGFYSNSFLIIAGLSGHTSVLSFDFDFVRFPQIWRKTLYRQVIKKAKGATLVSRLSMSPRGNKKVSTKFVTHRDMSAEEYVEGRVLSQQWADMLAIYPRFDEFSAYLKEYYQWLVLRFDQDDEAGALVDALPQNIIVGKDRSWGLIDQEWKSIVPLGPEQVFFRAVMNFCLSYRHVLSGIEPDSMGSFVVTVKDLLFWSFKQIERPLGDAKLVSYVEWENQFQKQIIRTEFRQNFGSVIDESLYKRRIFNQWQATPLKPLKVEVYWSQIEGVWHEDHSVFSVFSSGEAISVRLKLPSMVASHRYLRIDPAHEDIQAANARMFFLGLKVIAVNGFGNMEEKKAISSSDELVSEARLKDIILIGEQDEVLITSRDAQLILDLNGLTWEDDLDHVLLELDFKAQEGECSLAQRLILAEEDSRLSKRVWLQQDLLAVQQERLVNVLADINDVDENYKKAEARLVQLEAKIHKASLTWREKLKSWFMC